MVTVVEFVISLGKVVPGLISLIDGCVALYMAKRYAEMRQSDRDGVKKAVQEQDQRDLEHSINSPLAGLPSGIPGTEIKDSLPGVKL